MRALSRWFVVASIAQLGACANLTPIEDAATLWSRGDFVAFKRVCISSAEPACVARQAEFALLENRAADALDLLAASNETADGPTQRRTGALRAEAHYRLRHFDDAARELSAIGRDAAARKLAHFNGATPYRVETTARETILPFLQTEPLPIVELTVDGVRGRFIIDTGGSELILDPTFAATINAPNFGAETGTFGGGGKTAISHSAVKLLELGAFRLHDVPALLLDTKKFALVGGGQPVAGVLGTSVFYRFTATLDYPRSRLILRTVFNVQQDLPPGASSLPMWLAGDHFVLARGRIGSANEALMFIDTGLAGPAFAAPASTIAEAGIAVSGQSYEGVSGAGTVSVTPVVASSLDIGPIRLAPAPGLAGAFPPSLEQRFGFRIGGLLSHGVFRGHAITFDFAAMRLHLYR